MIKDRIVVGIRNSTLSEKMQLDAELTLTKAVTQVHQAEALKQQQSLSHSLHDAPIRAVKRGKSGTKSNKPKLVTTLHLFTMGVQDHTDRCATGVVGAHPTIYLYALPVIRLVITVGHFKVVCRSQLKVGGVDTTSDQSESSFLGSISGEEDS